MKFITSVQHDASAGDASVLVLANDADPRAANLQGIARVDLNFPKFTDGRAFSQAFLRLVMPRCWRRGVRCLDAPHWLPA
ncbi:MAG: DUF934 domain-containing protein [Rhodoferax sp.]